MIYRNEKTGAVLETALIISGGDWVKVDDQPKSTQAAPKKKRKKSGEES